MPGKSKSRLIKGNLPKSKIWIPIDQKECESKDSQDSQAVFISVAEWETLRLCDLENFKQREVAQIMHLSQPTVNRILSKAHTKIVQALFNGKALEFESNLIHCTNCKENLSTNVSKGSVKCPNCNHSIKLVSSD